MKKLKYYPSNSKENLTYDHVHITFDKQVPMHQQGTWELAYIITGAGIRIIGDVVENFSSGEVILIPPDTPHCWHFDKKVLDEQGKIENICIFFKPDLLNLLENHFPELVETVSLLKDNQNALSFLGETQKKLQDYLMKMRLQNGLERLSTFILILGELASSASKNIVGNKSKERKNEKKLHEIYMFILNNYHHEIILQDVAKAVGMPKSTFCLFFKKMTGKSFVSYLTDFRIESSCQMLQKTNMTVSEICIASGFNDIPYYNRTFKKIKKQTPTEYRKANA